MNYLHEDFHNCQHPGSNYLQDSLPIDNEKTWTTEAEELPLKDIISFTLCRIYELQIVHKKNSFSHRKTVFEMKRIVVNRVKKENSSTGSLPVDHRV